MASSGFPIDQPIDRIEEEQLPVPAHRRHGWRHFLGLYGAEHVSATEFVIGATFVGLGAGVWDILLGLTIGNVLAMLSFALITAPIATRTRLSIYAYLERIAGDRMGQLYNGANVLIFGAISAAMITVSATAVRSLFEIPLQTEPYPTSVMFILVAIAVGAIVVLVAAFGFNALSEFATICTPWLMVMFTVGGMVLIPALAESVTGYTTLASFSDFVLIAGESVFTGINAQGEPGIGFWEVVGFAWAANTITHFGLIDTTLLRYAKHWRIGFASAVGMLFGHYVAWISAGLMGAATAALMKISITNAEPGDVAFYALGASGFVIVVVAGWTTANANLYRAGLAAQALLPSYPRWKTTLLVGIGVVIGACFPFIYRSILPLLTYAGVILVPVGGIAFAEHWIFPRIGMSQYWLHFKKLSNNVPAITAWALSLIFAVGLNLLDVMPYYYLFLPTWVVSIVTYTLLARQYGAAEDFTEQKRELREFEQRVDEHFESHAAEEHHEPLKDTSLLTKIIKTVWIVIGLAVPAVLGWRVMFDSPDMYAYYVNRQLFYDVTIWCTVIYFVFAYWDLRRSKAADKAADAESGRSADPEPAE